jgi:hypothetical protein
MMPVYLRETTQTSARTANAKSVNRTPVDLISEEDLLANSNFDRISKILPRVDTLNTEENDQDVQDLSQGLFPNASSNDRRLVANLLAENAQLKQLLAETEREMLALRA